MATAVVRGGLRPADFERLTPAEWVAIQRAIVAKEEAEYRTGWEQTRSLYYASVAPYLEGRQTAQTLMPLPWDSTAIQTPRKQATAADLQRIREKFGD